MSMVRPVWCGGVWCDPAPPTPVVRADTSCCRGAGAVQHLGASCEWCDPRLARLVVLFAGGGHFQ